MIALLRGRLERKAAANAVIMAGGVGYEVHIPLPTFYDLPDEGAEVSLHIKTVVREDAIELFGFLTPGEKEAFLLLNTVSKIGPRLAMSILSGIGPAELTDAVRLGDVARLSSVPGVGKKTAERLVVELKDKVAHLTGVSGPAPKTEPKTALDNLDQDVVSALNNLGYRQNEAEKAVRRVRKESADNADLSDLIRQSLKILQKV